MKITNNKPTETAKKCTEELIRIENFLK